MVTFKKYFVFFLAWALMLGAVVLAQEVAEATAVYYLGVISAFLGIDVAITIARTRALPAGQFEKLEERRYLTVSITTFVILAVSFWFSSKGFTLDATINVLVSAEFCTAGLYIGALEGNKLATGKPVIETGGGGGT